MFSKLSLQESPMFSDDNSDQSLADSDEFWDHVYRPIFTDGTKGSSQLTRICYFDIKDKKNRFVKLTLGLFDHKDTSTCV